MHFENGLDRRIVSQFIPAQLGLCCRCIAAGMRAIGVGTLDDPKWIKPKRFGWFRSAHSWLKPPEGVEVVQKSALPPRS